MIFFTDITNQCQQILHQRQLDHHGSPHNNQLLANQIHGQFEGQFSAHPPSSFQHQREMQASNPADCKINPMFFGQHHRGYQQQRQFPGGYPHVPATMETGEVPAELQEGGHVFNNPYAPQASQQNYDLPSNNMPGNEDFFFDQPSNDAMFPNNKVSVANMNCNNNNNVPSNQTLPNITMLSKVPLTTTNHDDQLLSNLDQTAPSPCNSCLSLQNFSQDSPNSSGVEPPASLVTGSYLIDLLGNESCDVTKGLPSLGDVIETAASC